MSLSVCCLFNNVWSHSQTLVTLKEEDPLRDVLEKYGQYEKRKDPVLQLVFLHFVNALVPDGT